MTKFYEYNKLTDHLWEYEEFSMVSYEMYCEALDLVMVNRLDEGFFDKIKEFGVTGKLVKAFNEMKVTIQEIMDNFKIGFGEIMNAFKQKSVFHLMKSFGFNIKLMWKSIHSFTDLARKGILNIFEELHKSGIVQKVRSGVMKIDEVLEKYPLLKKLSGLVVAGLLLYIWLNMSFIGNFKYDFDFTDIINALKGSFSITDLFVSPSGMMLLSLFATGGFMGISVPWLGKTSLNLIMAILYNGFLLVQKHSPEIKDTVLKLKSKLVLSKA